MVKYSLPTVQQATERIVADTGESKLLHLCSPELVANFEADYRYHQTLDRFWHRSCTPSKWSYQPSSLGFMQSLDIWPSLAAWSRVMNRLVGFAGIKKTKKVLYGSAGRAAYQPGALIRWEDRPGQLQAFGVIGRNGKCEVLPVEKPSSKNRGLLGLQALGPRQQIIYGIGDPLTYLQLQHHNSYVSRDLLPLVGWTEGPTKSWHHVHTDTLILWQPIMGWEVFAAARQASSALVARLDMDATALKKAVCNPHLFLESLKAAALPWQTALCRWAENMSIADTRYVISMLQLTEREWKSIVDKSGSKDNKKLDSITRNVMDLTERTVCGNHHIVARNGCWWVSKSENLGKEELLTNSPFRIHTVIYKEREGCTAFLGSILHAGKTTPFEVEETLLRKDPVKFFRGLLVQKGVGYPQFTTKPSLIRVLVDAAIAMHPPEIASTRTRIGWNSNEGKYALPCLSISEEAIVPAAFSGDKPDAVPAYGVREAVIPDEAVKRWVSQAEVFAAFWALTSAVLHNTSRKMFEGKPLNIGAVGTKSSIVGQALQAVVKRFGLLEINIKSKQDLEMFRSACSAHDLPAVGTFTIDRPKLISDWLDHDCPGNGIIMLSLRAAFAASLYPNWVFVIGSKAERAIKMPAFEGLVPCALQRMIKFANVRERGVMGEAVPDVSQILTEMHKWVSAMIVSGPAAKRAEETFGRGKLMLRMCSPIGYALPQDRFLNYLFRLQDDSMTKLPSAKEVLEIDEKNEVVLIHMSRLGNVTRKLGFAPPENNALWVDSVNDNSVIDRAHRSTGILPIRKSYWDAKRAEWDSSLRDSLSMLNLLA